MKSLVDCMRERHIRQSVLWEIQISCKKKPRLKSCSFCVLLLLFCRWQISDTEYFIQNSHKEIQTKFLWNWYRSSNFPVSYCVPNTEHQKIQWNLRHPLASRYVWHVSSVWMWSKSVFLVSFLITLINCVTPPLHLQLLYVVILISQSIADAHLYSLISRRCSLIHNHSNYIPLQVLSAACNDVMHWSLKNVIPCIHSYSRIFSIMNTTT